MMKKFLIIFVVLFFTVMFSGSAKAQDTENPIKTETETQKSSYDQNIVIKKKPHPRVSSDCEQSSGRTRVLVTFDKSEKITDVKIIISSGCFGFDQNAMRAAKEIKFKAAMKDGEPVTVKKQVEYAYMLGARGF